MRIIILALTALALSACATGRHAPLSDLAPVFGNERLYHGAVFIGDVYAVRTSARGVYGVTLAPDADIVIRLDQWASLRMERLYHAQHGQRFRIRAVIREARLVMTQAAAGGECQDPREAGFYLTRVQVLGEP